MSVNILIKNCSATFYLNNCKSWRKLSSQNVPGNLKRKYVYSSLSKPMNIATKEETEQYQKVFPEVVDAFVKSTTNIPELQDRYRSLLWEHAPKEKQEAGPFALFAYKSFEDPNKITPQSIKLASIVGWCCAVHFCSFVIVDDMMDSSKVRYGKPCWFRREQIGMQAANDAVVMLGGIHSLLRKYFSGHPAHLPIVERFNEMTTEFSVGQSLDMLCRTSSIDMSQFSWHKYRTLTKCIGAYPTFIIPSSLGLHLAGRHDQKLHDFVASVSSELGFFFIVQNDMLDCYGDPAITGKVGNDIPQGKCTWLLLTALDKASAVQKKTLMKHYGKTDGDSETLVRNIYEEVGILHEFRRCEEQSYLKACRMVQAAPSEINKGFFQNVTNSVYGKSD